MHGIVVAAWAGSNRHSAIPHQGQRGVQVKNVVKNPRPEDGNSKKAIKGKLKKIRGKLKNGSESQGVFFGEK